MHLAILCEASHVWHMQVHPSKASVKIRQVIIAISYVELSNDGYVVSSLGEKQCIFNLNVFYNSYIPVVCCN